MKSAFEGIKIADFSSAAVGPDTAKYFAVHGALVVKVESKKFIDSARSSPPFREGVFDPDGSAVFSGRNLSKYGLMLDLKNARGKMVLDRLARWADVLIQNFTPETSERLGLDYDALRAVNPGLIVANSTQMGQSGPHSAFKGYGGQGAAMAGYPSIVGYSEDEPRIPYGGYTDFIAHRYLIVAIIMALLHRRKTGRGNYIDQSQVESTLHYLSPAILDYVANGRVAHPAGNKSSVAPHNAYRCRGDDRWCVIAIYTDGEWQGFCRAIGNPFWCQDHKFATLPGRKENEQELDGLIEGWTTHQTPEEAMHTLQQSGVAAAIVARPEDLHNDPQLKHRDHFWVSNHPVIGPHTCDAPGFRLSKTPAQCGFPAPCIGPHNHYVCTQLLGMSEEEFDDLARSGVFA